MRRIANLPSRKFGPLAAALCLAWAWLAGPGVAALDVAVPGGTLALKDQSWDGISWVCADEVASALHGTFGQDAVSNYPAMTLRGRRILISTASTVVSVDGKIAKLQHVPVKKEGCLWLPQEFLTQVLPGVIGGPVTLGAPGPAPGPRPAPPPSPGPGLPGPGLPGPGLPEPPKATVPAPPPPAGEGAVSVDVGVSVDTVRITLTGGLAPAAEVRQEELRLIASLPQGTFAPTSRPLGQGIAERMDVEGGGRKLVVRLGAGFRRAESLKLRNPDRLVILLKGEGQTVPPVPPELPPTQPEAPSEPEAPVVAAPSAPPARTAAFDVVVLDPGHGGTDTGAIGASGTQEKELTLVLAQRLAAELERRGLKAVLTRTSDASIPLVQRTALANFNQADLFVSIHLNSAPGRSAKGAETYYLSKEATDLWSSELAARENLEFGEEVTPRGELNLVLWELAQSSHIRESAGLAEMIQQEFNSLLGTKDRGVRQAPFAVLEGAQMPAVLVEVAFLSNPQEAKRLADPAFQDQVTSALARAVLGFKARYENPQALRSP